MEKALIPADDEPIDFSEEEIEVSIEGEEEEPFVEPQEPQGHNVNLAEILDEETISRISSEVMSGFDNDVQSRSDWADSYVKGLDLLGMKVEERMEPWPGAAGVFHPVLAKAVIEFQSEAISELLPADGPAKAKIVGRMTKERIQQAERVRNELNYLITEVIPGYYEETEQMLFRLALAGSAFKKVYYDPVFRVPTSCLVPAEDFVINYGASSLMGAERYSHIMRKSRNEIERLMSVGFYRSIDLPDPSPEQTDIQAKYDELNGERSVLSDDRHMIIESHINLHIDEDEQYTGEYALPYVVTVDKSSGEILSIYRNWYEGDTSRKKRIHFVHYRYMPGLGFYGMGLIHILGGLSKTATSLLRQLIDAGTLSNLPSGLKAKGLRVKGDNRPFYPGEFRDVDVAGGSIRDNIYFLPFKEPSSVLYQLMISAAEEAQGLGATINKELASISPNAPVGTTLALIERSLKVLSAVKRRLHNSMKQELRLIAGVVKDYMDDEYAYDVGEGFSRKKDFDDRIDVIPVSDPNASTMGQRIMQYQAAIQQSQMAPQLYNMGKLHRMALEAMGIQDADEIVKLPDDIKPMDPVTENMAILKQEPVKVFAYQDHEAHIRAHMAAMQDPKIKQIVGQSPFAAAIQSAIMSHITEHVAYAYRKEIEKTLGVPLPGEDTPLPEDVERDLAPVIAKAAEKLLNRNQQEMAQQEAQQKAQDPVVQMQMEELRLKKERLEREMSLEERKLQLQEKIKSIELQIERERNKMNIDVQRENIEAANKRKGAEIGMRAAEVVQDADLKERLKQMEIAKEAAAKLVREDVDVDGK